MLLNNKDGLLKRKGKLFLTSDNLTVEIYGTDNMKRERKVFILRFKIKFKE